MKTKAKKVKADSFKKFTIFLVLILFSVLGFIFNYIGLFQNLDYRVYDSLLKLKKPVPENKDIVLVDIDDESMARIGAWPWTRDILGNVLIRMKEFNAKQAVFDIEYLSPASKGVNDSFLDTVDSSFDKGGEQTTEAIMQYAQDIKSGTIEKKDIESSAEDTLGKIIGDYHYKMKREIEDEYIDYDDFFARAIQFFGNVSLTTNTREIGIERSEEDIAYVHNRFLFDNVKDSHNLIKGENEFAAKEESSESKVSFTPALSQLVEHANGVGFTNVVIDKDGVRRRVELFNYHDGKYLGQLSFAPFVKLYDAQEFIRNKRSLTIKGIKLGKNGERIDIKVPLDRNGRMLINWSKTNYGKSFIHCPVYMIYNLDLEENLIKENLSAFSQADTDSLLPDDEAYIREGITYFIDESDSINEKKENILLKCRGFTENGEAKKGGLTEEDYADYFNQKNEFYTTLKEFADGFKDINGAGDIPELNALKDSINGYLNDISILAPQFNNAFCLIGNSASASTDLGTTPFEKRYANLGTHANVINTIIQQSFIHPVDTEWAIIFQIALTILILACAFKHSAGMKNALGLIYVILPVIIYIVLMIYFQISVAFITPTFIAVAVYLTDAIINFRALNADKKFLQTKFGAYVSPDVVKEMQKNPELAELGAQNKYMTALFSDVQTFSGFTETLNNKYGEERGAVELQKILSDYLGYLTKEIQLQKGTVDKFVGDEIVSFFNAPLDDEDHAFHGCIAGIRMLQAEARYNEENIETLPVNEKTGEKFLLHSRVGLNTGYMAVGNMGTSDKMNYTVMGNAVNLASRLEGTNKAYGSWIMVSDSTWKAANSGIHKNELLERKFDCVRVINVKKPVQIHNILGLKSELPPEQIEAAMLFNEGMNWYLKGSETPEVPKDPADFKKAYAYFEKAKKCFPADASSDVFMKRCVDIIKNGVPQIWDGVYTMKTK